VELGYRGRQYLSNKGLKKALLPLNEPQEGVKGKKNRGSKRKRRKKIKGMN